jgi:putative chitinase
MILRLQHTLSRMGYEPGRLDGVLGPRTRGAIREAERAAGLRQTGQPSGVLIADLDRRLAGLISGIGWLRLEDIQSIATMFPSSHLPLLQAALIEISATPTRAAHFIAQIAHESAGFMALIEYASGAAYEGRSDLGNTQPGDGKRYKGRGVIQLTGRANYRKAGAYLGLDLEKQPDLAAVPSVAYQTAAYYWLDRNINAHADRDDILAVTRAINGGTNGLKHRQQLLKSAKAAFYLDIA